MRNHKKLVQREEVRRILHAMRLELAAQSAAHLFGGSTRTVISIAETLKEYRHAHQEKYDSRNLPERAQ